MTKIMLPPLPQNLLSGGQAMQHQGGQRQGRTSLESGPWSELLFNGGAANSTVNTRHDEQLAFARLVPQRDETGTTRADSGTGNDAYARMTDNGHENAVLVLLQAIADGRISFIHSYTGMHPVSGTEPVTPQAFTTVPAAQPARHSNPITRTADVAWRHSSLIGDTNITTARSVGKQENALAESNRSSQPKVMLAEWLARRLHLIPRDGNIDVRVRDYRLSSAEVTQLVDAILEAANRSNTPIRKITVNGHIAWQTDSTGEAAHVSKEHNS